MGFIDDNDVEFEDGAPKRAPRYAFAQQQLPQVLDVLSRLDSAFPDRNTYYPSHAGTDRPVMIREYFRVFITPEFEVAFEGGNLDEIRFAEDAIFLRDEMRKVIPDFGKNKSLEAVV